MVRYKDEAGRKIKAANFITDDLSLLAAAAMKKFKHFVLSSPYTSKPSAKNPTFFFFFSFADGNTASGMPYIRHDV